LKKLIHDYNTRKSITYQLIMSLTKTSNKIMATTLTTRGMRVFNATPELKLPDSSDGYDEIVIDIVGNVDSGKSSLCGILSHPILRDDLKNLNDIFFDNETNVVDDVDQKLSDEFKDVLDDGNGSARSRVVNLKHEKDTGRTSSISYHYMIFDVCKPRPRIVSLVDLAGHEQYLKTTITGVISSYPEHGMVLVAKNITHMTREHYSILASMGIPVLFVMTKIDIIPNKIINENIKKITTMSKRFGKSLIEIKNVNNIKTCLNDDKTFGFVQVSNKTGSGIHVLADYIRYIKKKPKNLVAGFAIDRVYYNITGFGIVVSGINGATITKGESMVMGPFDGNRFITVKIRSIHDDYRNFVDVLQPGSRGCLCIRFDTTFKTAIRMGMVITHKKSDVHSVKKFEAHVAIFRGKSSNIKVGYNSYINVGLTRGSVKFTRIRDKDTGVDLELLNKSHHAHVDLEFMSGHACLNINDRFIFRSHRTHGIGKVVAVID
jgi:elongation factor 1-alpha